MTKLNDGMFSTGNTVIETPQWLFDLLDAEFHFTLDACALAENAKCARYYTPEDDGLKRKWEGSVWVNPPYGREIGKWTDRAKQQIRYKRVEWVVMLLPARTDTKWWHRSVMKAAQQIRFIEGRLRFVGATGSAPFPSIIVIYHRNRRTYPYLIVGPTINARGQ